MAEKRWYQITHKVSGEQQIVCGLDGYDTEDWTVRELEREPAEHEYVDANGRIQKDEEALIDARYGVDHIVEARAAKLAEARIILAGVPIDGLVSAEAAVRGVTTEALAESIAAKAQPMLSSELSRVSAKIKLL